MNQEQKRALSALWKAWWLPMCGGILGLIVGVLILIVGFWKTLLVFLLMILGVMGGWLIRRRLAHNDALRGLFNKSGEDDFPNF